jgi:hypothetical protein
MVARASSNRATGLDQSTPYGSLPSRSPVPIPRIARPRVIRCSVAAACAVTAGLRRPVSVTQVPRRARLNRWRPARWPSAVHGSSNASISGASRAAPVCFAVITACGSRELRWSGSQYESAPPIPAVR